MQKINCNVGSCSHNKTGVCFANRVNIGGDGATQAESTCCGSFLDKKNYGSLTNNTNEANKCGECATLVCTVSSCTHNESKLCNLSSIDVNGQQANLYTETNCNSFSTK